MADFRPRLKGKKKKAFDHITKAERRILVIGDLHAPFVRKGYLDFCKETYYNYNCNQVIFIGDIIDNHYSSYHETDPDGLSGGDELDFAIEVVRSWAQVFPKADVIIGNHDRIIMRKAFSSAIPKRWVREYNEVLGTNWNWVERIEYDNVQYVHGEGGTARTKGKNDMMCTVQGHIHTQSYTEWMVGKNFRIFAMQVGCGIDSDSYAAAYARHFKRQAIGCGVVVGGHTAINVLMDL
ncbi:MAG TPA: metallophosphoesterase [Candidatus Paceibacterota bacterium]|nr:metallophosphoesterase [Candidatus Paceibacterota bacterium]